MGTADGIMSVSDDTPIPWGRIKVGNVTVELELMVMPLPADQEPLVIKLLSLPDMGKEVGVFKVTLTNEDNNVSVMEVLSMEFAPVPKVDPPKVKKRFESRPPYYPRCCR